jgi:pimeloyl-ACP methyl ester carboxylesterase
MSTVRSKDGTTIGFEQTGHGPALILVDGALCSRAMGPMGALARRLAADFTVIRYDRRGRGESTDTPPYAVEREVEDISALVEAAGGSASLFGISSGAALALEAAARGLAIPKAALYEPPFIVDDSRAPVRAPTGLGSRRSTMRWRRWRRRPWWN